MTVGELIALLQKYDRETRVEVFDSGYGFIALEAITYNGSKVCIV